MSIINSTLGVASDLRSILGKTGFMIVDPNTGLHFKFDTYFHNAYDAETNVPSQPLEYNTFSVDSKQIRPNIISVTASKGISVSSSVANVTSGFMGAMSVAQFKKNLDTLAKSPNLVNIYITPLFTDYAEIYNDYVLKTLSWENHPQQLYLLANMTFQEVRMTSVQYKNIQTPIDATNTPTQNSGQAQPVPVQTSVLKNVIG